MDIFDLIEELEKDESVEIWFSQLHNGFILKLGKRGLKEIIIISKDNPGYDRKNVINCVKDLIKAVRGEL